MNKLVCTCICICCMGCISDIKIPQVDFVPPEVSPQPQPQPQPLPTPIIKRITSDEEFSELIQIIRVSKKTTLVHLQTQGCEWCKKQQPIIEELSEIPLDINFWDIYQEECPKNTKYLIDKDYTSGPKGFPTLILMKYNGVKFNWIRLVGFTNKNTIHKNIQKLHEIHTRHTE